MVQRSNPVKRCFHKRMVIAPDNKFFNINSTSIPEINTANAIILHKGHNKDKNLATSYRTISTCPILSKAIDKYIRELSIEDWNLGRSEVQFLGPGMGHDMAALLLSETIQFSKNVDDRPLFAIFLDARAAFDKTLNSRLCRNLYFLDTTGKRLIYLDNRLRNRRTFVE